jgi:hypothetical protein
MIIFITDVGQQGSPIFSLVIDQTLWNWFFSVDRPMFEVVSSYFKKLFLVAMLILK